MDSDDEVWRDLERMLRSGFVAAGQFAEQFRRRQAEADRRARDAAYADQRATKSEIDAIKNEAREKYQRVGWADWQGNASLDDWAEAYRYARAMRESDPIAGAAHRRIEDEVKRRYNVDIRQALDEHLLQVAEDQRTRAEQHADEHQADEDIATAQEKQQSAKTAADEERHTQTQKDAADANAESPAASHAAGDRRAGRDDGGKHAPDATVREPTPDDILGTVSEQDADYDAAVKNGDPGVVDVVTGDVLINEDEFHAARAESAAAAAGFGQRADDAVRQSRGRPKRPTAPRAPRAARNRQRSGGR